MKPALRLPKSHGVATIPAALERSVPEIQSGDEGFTAKAGGISCHNNNLAAPVVSPAQALRARVNAISM